MRKRGNMGDKEMRKGYKGEEEEMIRKGNEEELRNIE